MKKLRSKVCKSVLALALFLTMASQAVLVNAKTADDNFGVGNKVMNTTSDLNTDIPTSDTIDGVAGFGKPGADGRIWVDKSVTDKEDGTFNVKLSALTQEFTSTKAGASSSSTAADVVFVLDGSSSMGEYGISNDIDDGSGNKLYRLQAMVDATNQAISIIMKANPKNRIAVNWYYGDNGAGSYVDTVLALDTYVTDDGKDFFEWSGSVYGQYATSKLYYGTSLKNSKGIKLDNGNNDFATRNGFDAYGGTPTQKGMAYAINETIKNINSADDNGERKPYVFLLSDGGASLGNSDWSNEKNIIDNPSNIGDGNETALPGNEKVLDKITSNLILTSAYMKDKLNDAYNTYNVKFGHQQSDTKVYTVGLGSDINGPYVNNDTKADIKYAWCGLQPSAIEKAINNIPYWTPGQTWDPAQQTAASNVKKYIEEYVDAAVNNGKTELAKYKNENSYNYSDYYSYAKNYAALEEAFKELANDVESATKVIQPPVYEDAASKSSIYYHDSIGNGMLINGTLKLSINGGGVIEGKEVVRERTATSKVYKFDGFEGKAVVNTQADKTQSVDWYITANDLKQCTYTISGSSYVSKKPLTLDYDIVLSPDVDPTTSTTYYTNTVTGTGSNMSAESYVRFLPIIDNPYYFYTNIKAGKIGKLADVGLDLDNDISHYVKGESVAVDDDLSTISDVYITTDMATAKDSPYSIEDAGKIADTLKTSAIPYSSEFETATRASMKNCVQATDASDTTGTMYAFKTGIQKEHNHVVEKSTNANKTNTTTYLSKESFINGEIKMLLGNNGRVDIKCAISKATPQAKAIGGDTVTYQITVNNYSTTPITDLVVEDAVPTGLTNITDTTAAGIADYVLTGNNVKWTNVKVPANGAVVLSISAKVQSVTSDTKIENVAKIVGFGTTDLDVPAISDKTETLVKEGIDITINKDNTVWTDSAKTYQVSADGVTFYELNGTMPDGNYKVYEVLADGTKKNTNIPIVIADRTGNATIDYYTVTLHKDTGITSISEKSTLGVATATDDQYLFLKGETAIIEATSATGYQFSKWVDNHNVDKSTNKEYSVQVNAPIELTAKAVLKTGIVTVDINLNGVDYPAGSDYPTVKLVDKTDATKTFTDMTKVPEGTYFVYANDEKTTKEVTVTTAGGTVVLDYYTLTVKGDQGVASVSGTGNYLEGKQVSASVTLKPDFAFVKWTGGSTATTNPVTITIAGKTEITAQTKSTILPVAKIDFQIYKDNSIWSDSGKNIILKDPSGNIVDKDHLTVAGTYTFEGDLSGSFTVTQTQIDNQETIVRRFDYYTLDLKAGTGIQSVGETTHKYVFLKDEKANITASLKDNYVFVNWTNAAGQQVTTHKETEITMDAPKTLTANAKAVYKVNIGVDLDGADYADFTKKITLKNSGGIEIKDLNHVPNGEYTVYVDGKETYLKVTVNGTDITKTLEYFTVTLNKGTGIANVSGQGIYLKGEKTTISATVEKDYKFKNWTGDSTITNQQKEVIVNKTLSYTANAEKTIVNHKVSIDINKDGEKWINHGKTMTLKDNAGKIIENLDQVKDGTYTIYVDGMTTGKTLTVKGEDVNLVLDYFTLILDKGNGIKEITGNGIYLSGTKASIDANVMEGYTFAGWTGTYNYTGSYQTFYINEKTTLKANAILSTDKKPDSPETSDGSLISLYGAMATVSSLLAVVLSIRKKLIGKEDEKER